MEKFLVVAVVGIVVIVLFVPGVRRTGTRLLSSSEQITLPGVSSAPLDRSVEIVTLLGFDAIPAILDPSFASVAEAEPWMEETEQVLGVSINGEHRAYSVKMLSRHEIVNDVVGGVPVAVTW